MYSPTLASKLTRSRLVAGIMALALFSAAEMSYASTIAFSSSTGTWTSPTAVINAINPRISGEDSGGLYWGNPWSQNGDPSTQYAGTQKSVTFTGISNTSPVGVNPDKDAFVVGWFGHNNTDVWEISELSSATLKLKLLLDGNEKTFNYQMASSVDANYADTLNFSNVSQQFTLGNQSYSFELLGFYDASTKYNSGIQVDSGQQVSNIALWASITTAPTPVPAPAALWLLGSGLLGLAGFSKRKRIPQ